MAKEEKKEKELISCLKNERVIVRFVPKANSKITNSKHVLYGGMAETAVRTFTTPRLSSGRYTNVLTDDEKDFLESYMGLEPNALSIYKKEHNFWDDSNPDGISTVTLRKQDNYLDLSNPEEYIKYKILLANKDYIAPSLETLENFPKATYQFVLIAEGDEVRSAKSTMTTTMQCYKEYGKVENDIGVLKFIVETLEGKGVAPNVKIEFLQTKVNELIQSNAKKFLATITDKTLPSKVFIKKAFAAGHIAKRGDYYYLRSDGSPLCELNEEPTLNMAAKYLNNPKHQDVKFGIEALLNQQ